MHNIIQSEVKDLFTKFSYLREETEKQFSAIINAHSESINNGIRDIIQEVSKLQGHVSVITNERNVLLETVANLNGEIRQLNAKLPFITQENEEIHNRDTQYLIDSEEETPGTEEINIFTKEKEVVENGDERDHDGATQVLDDSKQETTPVGNTMRETKEFHYQADQNVDDFKKETPVTDADHFVERTTIKLENCDEEESVCRECDFTFSTNENLKIHFKNFHSQLNVSGEDPVELGTQIGNSKSAKSKMSCQECGKAFLNQWHLKQHRDSVHKQGDKTYKCNECFHQTNDKYSLKKHINGVHNNIRSHKCEECGNAFFSKKDLKRHRDSVHKMGDQEFKCEQCPYSTFDKHTLVRHNKAVHEKIKNHACSECDYATYEKRNLNYHMISSHGKGGKKFKCKKCSYSSPRRHLMVQHNESVHEKMKNHVCSLCNYASHSKRSLHGHIESVHRAGNKNKVNKLKAE